MKISVRSASLVACVLIIVSVLAIRAQNRPPATYLSESELMAGLKKAADPVRGQNTVRIQVTEGHNISFQQRTKAAGVIVHDRETEVQYIVDGAATLVTGGSVVKSGQNATIDGGESRRVTKGDVIVIPLGTPHWWQNVEGTVTYFEARWQSPTSNPTSK